MVSDVLILGVLTSQFNYILDGVYLQEWQQLYTVFHFFSLKPEQIDDIRWR
jgi:hypothetical protein